MAEFTFNASFSEFLPEYMNVTRVWIGNGQTTGTLGELYAEYLDGHIADLGSVSLYATAVEQGYQGTPEAWLRMIMSISDLVQGSEVNISYQVSESGTTHPDSTSGWSPTPVFEKGKFTWAKFDMRWIDGNITSLYLASYQGKDGQVQSINGEVGDLILNGENLPIAFDNDQSIKEYVDINDIPLTATNDDIDAMFSMALFSGAAFIAGRRFVEGDSVTYKIEPVTEDAPLPESDTVTIHPTGGTSCSFKFGNIVFSSSDIPTGQTTKTFEYTIRETAHTLDGTDSDPTVHHVSVTLQDNGDGIIHVIKSDNFNTIYFSYRYTALGRIIFEGSIQLNGRQMAAREFMVQIKEGNEIIADNISTAVVAASGEPTPIIFPPINYTLDDIGHHTYTVKQTSISGDGVTIDNTVYTVNVQVLDEIRDGHLEIITDGSDKGIDFVNTYEASGYITFIGNHKLINRLYRDGDVVSMGITGTGKLPNPTTINIPYTIGSDDTDFSFARVEYTLLDMRNTSGGYDDMKTFTYNVTETSNIGGLTPDGRAHVITVTVTDNKHGNLIVVCTYNDGEKIQFTDTYSAYGTLTIIGEKNLINRKFVATDSMYVKLTSSNGKLPYVSYIPVTLTPNLNKVNFNFIEIRYDLADLLGEPFQVFNYMAVETTVITGAINDENVHTLDVYVADNYDGTLTVTPTYSDGEKFVFTSTYDATGYISLVGTKNIVNRVFKNDDLISVAISSSNGGKLPNPANISVELLPGASTANFSFSQITYKVTDLGGLTTKTFNYTITETTTMDGTTPVSLSDSVAVEVTDLANGTLRVVPTYTSGDRATLTNVYSATGDLDFTTRVNFTNGDLSVNPIGVKIMQVTGNNSTTQATQNVVLAAPVIQTANSGSSQDITFDNIVQFVKNSNRNDTSFTYWFLIQEDLPSVDSQGIYNNVKYDTNKKWINVTVTDNLDGTLNITKTPAPDSTTGLDMTFTNEQLADLTIVETWTGDHARLTTEEKNAFTYIVTGPASYSTSFTYEDMISNRMVLEHLSLGQYTVTQTNNTVENFIITTTYKVNNVTTNNVTLVAGGAQLTVTNDVNIQEATLNIRKTWSGEDSRLTTQQKNAVTFTVTGPKQKSTDASAFSRTFTYADMINDVKIFEQLTLGTYTVTETNSAMQDFDVEVSYSVDGSSTSYVTLADNDNKTITVNGNYTYHKGIAKVTKQFSGMATKPVNYNITNNYNDSVFNYANADNKDDTDGITSPYEWAIEQIPVHTTVQFTEHNSEIENYTLQASCIPANRTCAAVTKDNTSTVAFTNTYTIHVGSVKVTKRFVGISAAQKPDNYAISNNYNGTVFSYANVDNPSADGVNIPYEWTIANVPVTTTITFTEHNTSITDYSVAETAVPANYTCAAVTKDTTSTVALTGTYTIHKGVVKVTKRFSGISAAQKPVNYNITNNYDNTIVFTPANANNASSTDGISSPYEWTITNVPVHTTIQFTENNVDIADHETTATSVPANRTCAAVVKDAISTVAFTSSYVMDTGSITVQKWIEGIPASQKPANFSITNDYNSDVFTFDNAINASIADGVNTPWKWNITNIPVHTVIVFAEHNADITNYDVSTTTLPANYTSSAITKNTNQTMQITSTYTMQTGSVRISKRFYGITSAQKPENFAITNNYNTDIFNYANADNASIANGVDNAYYWTITNVPVGTTISIEEYNCNIPNHILTATAVPANYTCDPVTKNTMSTISLTNSYTETGSIVVSKQFIGLTSEQLPNSFSISNNYNATVFTYANADNASTADGITIPYEWTIENIPVQTEIIFTENNTTVTGYELVEGTQTTITSDPVTYNTATTVDFVNEYEEEGE